MAFLQRLQTSIAETRACLCVGLDPDLGQLPSTLPKDANGVRQFLEAIIDTTAPYACVYKPNLAFFSSLGLEGLEVLKRIIAIAGERRPVILDAKFGDIGNTAKHYANTAFDRFGADAVTVNPYLGSDTLSPFFNHERGYSFVLGVTSNPGASQIQQQHLAAGPRVFESLAARLENEFPQNNWGWVAGATQVEPMADLRKASPGRWFLIPGVGAQGGDLAAALSASQSPKGETLAVVNASRSVLFASSGPDFAEAAGKAARTLAAEMEKALSGGTVS